MLGGIVDGDGFTERAAGAEVEEAELHVAVVEVGDVEDVAVAAQIAGGEEGFALAGAVGGEAEFEFDGAVGRAAELLEGGDEAIGRLLDGSEQGRRCAAGKGEANSVEKCP